MIRITTPDEVKAWLDSIQQDRAWLADLLKGKKGSVDQWFSKGFPEWALQIINFQRDSESSTKLQFTVDEWQLIQQAMADSGYTETFDFFHDAIIVFAEQITLPHSVDEAPGTADPKVLPIASTLSESPASYRKRKA